MNYILKAEEKYPTFSLYSHFSCHKYTRQYPESLTRVPFDLEIVQEIPADIHGL